MKAKTFDYILGRYLGLVIGERKYHFFSIDFIFFHIFFGYTKCVGLHIRFNRIPNALIEDMYK